MHKIPDNWRFGPVCSVGADRDRWWALHAPVVRAWIGEMEAAGDAWWVSAEHAAFCLVSHREMEAEQKPGPPNWDDLDVDYFLFRDMNEAGTVGIFGSVPIFFEHLVQALQRFIDAGLVDEARGVRWLEQMRAARPRFLEHFRGCDDDEHNVGF